MGEGAKDGWPSSPCGVPEGEGKQNGTRPGSRWARLLKSPDDFGTHPASTSRLSPSPRMCYKSEGPWDSTSERP
jgi:hypothetical protein